MNKTPALLLALLLTISLVSCALPTDSSSSMPTATDPVSSIVDSSLPDNSSEPTSSEKSSSSTVSPDPSLTTSSEATSSDWPTSSAPDTQPDTPVHTITPIKPENYYGYSRLSKFQKQAYIKMLEAADSMPNGYIELGSTDDLTERDVYLAAITLKNDHPEIFWLPYAWYIGETHNAQIAILFVNETDNDASGDIESFTAAYTVTRADKLRMQNELKAAVDKIKEKVTATDPYEIELQIHDILCDRISYSKTATPLSYTAYGALVNGDAVCEGYTRAMQLLLYEFGINSTPVTGHAGLQPHMWNLVELGGKWYHLDVTWNDDVVGYRHEYFNLTDPGISKDHIINNDFENFSKDEVLRGEPFNYKLPLCNTTEYYYFFKTGYAYNGDSDALIEYILSSNLSVIELVGWNDNAPTEITDALNKKNVNRKLHFEHDGSWAKLSVAQ